MCPADLLRPILHEAIRSFPTFQMTESIESGSGIDRSFHDYFLEPEFRSCPSSAQFQQLVTLSKEESVARMTSQQVRTICPAGTQKKPWLQLIPTEILIAADSNMVFLTNYKERHHTPTAKRARPNGHTIFFSSSQHIPSDECKTAVAQALTLVAGGGFFSRPAAWRRRHANSRLVGRKSRPRPRHLASTHQNRCAVSSP